mmetsp:Transcript_121232/g.354378  ORF Transcript_121232/g.354378 Transcript_121232/m.354378 type:complete len:781 (-) Transcript_121232:182-2524(-)
MGQSVSVDSDPIALEDLLGIRQGHLPQKPSDCLPEGAARHHIKAWKYEKQGHQLVCEPITLLDDCGHFDAKLQRTSSYVILHVRSGNSSGEDHTQSSILAELQEIAVQASATCTPRGLITQPDHKEASQSLPWSARLQAGNADGCSAGSALRFAIHVWYGLSVEQADKAFVFGKAEELGQKLRQGLLYQPCFLHALLKPVARHNDGQHPLSPGDHVNIDARLASDKVRQSGNSLLIALLEESGAGRAGHAKSRSGAASRFPRLSEAVARSGVAPATNAWMRDQRWPQVPASPSTHASAGCTMLPPMSAAASSSAVPPGVRPSGSGAAVPCLALGAAPASLPRGTSRSVETPPIAAPVEHDEAAHESAGCKRFKGHDSARSGQSSRGSARQGAMPPLNLSTLNGQRQLNSNRPDAPAMLSLEEVNMSEEEMLASYDPDNEENNYHLPHHVCKHLQLRHFRQVCSEVIPGALFISSFQVAGELESLRKHRITHIVNTAADVCQSCFPDQFNYITYYLKDTNNEDISLLFYRTLEWIQSAISSGGRVLVHCREGVSRSATMVIAYLMWRFSLSFEAAHEMLRKVRPICNPNTGFTFQLLLLGKKLSGTPACSSIHPAAVQVPPDRPLLFRIGPHHPKEPFLLLLPVEWSSPWPVVDPRFGWVVQRGSQLVCWIGSKVLDAAAVREAVFKHAHRLEAFERCQCTVKIIVAGEEPPLWQVLGLTSDPGDGSNLKAHRPEFDADFEILQALAVQADTTGVPTNVLQVQSPLSQPAPVQPSAAGACA